MKNLFLFAAICILSVASFAQSKTEMELKQIAEKLRNDSANSFIKTMEPTIEDLQGIFLSAEDVGKAWEHAMDFYIFVEDNINPTDEQSEIIVKGAIGADLRYAKEHGLPSQYEVIKEKIKNTTEVYFIEYVKKGEKSGVPVHTFIKVRDHWVYIPNLWEVFNQ